MAAATGAFAAAIVATYSAVVAHQAYHEKELKNKEEKKEDKEDDDKHKRQEDNDYTSMRLAWCHLYYHAMLHTLSRQMLM